MPQLHKHNHEQHNHHTNNIHRLIHHLPSMFNAEALLNTHESTRHWHLQNDTDESAKKSEPKHIQARPTDGQGENISPIQIHWYIHLCTEIPRVITAKHGFCLSAICAGCLNPYHFQLCNITLWLSAQPHNTKHIPTTNTTQNKFKKWIKTKQESILNHPTVQIKSWAAKPGHT